MTTTGEPNAKWHEGTEKVAQAVWPPTTPTTTTGDDVAERLRQLADVAYEGPQNGDPLGPVFADAVMEFRSEYMVRLDACSSPADMPDDLKIVTKALELWRDDNGQRWGEDTTGNLSMGQEFPDYEPLNPDYTTIASTHPKCNIFVAETVFLATGHSYPDPDLPVNYGLSTDDRHFPFRASSYHDVNQPIPGFGVRSGEPQMGDVVGIGGFHVGIYLGPGRGALKNGIYISARSPTDNQDGVYGLDQDLHQVRGIHIKDLPTETSASLIFRPYQGPAAPPTHSGGAPAADGVAVHGLLAFGDDGPAFGNDVAHRVRMGFDVPGELAVTSSDAAGDADDLVDQLAESLSRTPNGDQEGRVVFYGLGSGAETAVEAAVRLRTQHGLRVHLLILVGRDAISADDVPENVERVLNLYADDLGQPTVALANTHATQVESLAHAAEDLEQLDAQTRDDCVQRSIATLQGTAHSGSSVDPLAEFVPAEWLPYSGNASDSMESIYDLFQDPGDNDCGPTCAAFLRLGGAARPAGSPASEAGRPFMLSTLQGMCDVMRAAARAELDEFVAGTSQVEVQTMLRQFALLQGESFYDWKSADHYVDLDQLTQGTAQQKASVVAAFRAKIQSLLAQSPFGILCGFLHTGESQPSEWIATEPLPDAMPHWVVITQLTTDQVEFYDPAAPAPLPRSFPTLEFIYASSWVRVGEPMCTWTFVSGQASLELVHASARVRGASDEIAPSLQEIASGLEFCTLRTPSGSTEDLEVTGAPEWFNTFVEADLRAAQLATSAAEHDAAVIEQPAGCFAALTCTAAGAEHRQQGELHTFSQVSGCQSVSVFFRQPSGAPRVIASDHAKSHRRLVT